MSSDAPPVDLPVVAEAKIPPGDEYEEIREQVRAVYRTDVV
jgi:hypothetical protein